VLGVGGMPKRLLRTTGLAFVVLAAIGDASAADRRTSRSTDCAPLDAILGAAGGGFRALRGPARHEALGIWEATVVFPGGRDCLIYAPPLAMYACSLYMGNDEPQADASYRDAVARLRACVAKRWRIREQADALRTLTKAWHDPAAPSIFVVSTFSDAAAYRVDLWVDLPIRGEPKPRRQRR